MSNEYLNNKYLEGIICKFQETKREKARYEVLIDAMRKHPHRKARRLVGTGSMTLAECEREYGAVVVAYQSSQSLLATAFYTLSENIVRYAKFHLIDPDDAVQEGVMICFEKIDRFNPAIGKAFNYMTTCTINHYRQLYRTARNYNELKKKFHDFLLYTCDEESTIKRSKERIARISARNSHNQD